MSRTYTDLYVHIVWSTQGRKPWLIDSVEKPLYAAVTKKCRDIGCVPLALGGTVDHVHLLVALAPTIAVATLVKEIKGTSAHLMTHVLQPDLPFVWQRGYGAFSLRKNDVPAIRDYVMDQKNHHATKTLNAAWEPTIDDTGAVVKSS